MIRSLVVFLAIAGAAASVFRAPSTVVDAAMEAADDALLHARVGAGSDVQQEAFSAAVSQKNHGPHGHSAHGHSPHGHSPHGHSPFADSRRRRTHYERRRRCSAGEYKDTGNDTCKDCGKGRFQPAPTSSDGKHDQTSCPECAAGSHQPATKAAVCAGCVGPTSFSAAAGAATCTTCDYNCPAGKEHSVCGATSGGTCDQCAPGRFKPDHGDTSCQPCPSGRFSAGGASSCTACPTGQYNTVAEQSSCTRCAAGRHNAYEAMQRASDCLECNKGHYQGSTGQASCAVSPTGFHTPTVGATAPTACGLLLCSPGLEHPGCPAGTVNEPACTPCAAGQHRNNPMHQHCSTCAAGRYTPPAIASGGLHRRLGPATGAVHCTACPVKHECSTTAATLCKPGMFQDQLAQATCKLCATGRFGVGAGADDCVDCAAGRYEDTMGNVECKNCDYHCDAGKFASGCGLSGPGSCNQCHAGKFKATATPFGCSECSTGTFAALEGTKTCDACSATFYQDLSGANKCKDCNYHCGIGNEHTGCAGGSPGHCTPCAAGTAKAAAGGHACSDCTAGKFHASVGSATCKACAAGQFTSSVAQLSCEACDYNCPSGQFHAGCGAADSGKCNACHAGQFKAAASTAGCELCSSGHFQDSTGLASCKACSVHTYQPKSGTVSCDACEYNCPAGQFHTVCGGSAAGSCQPCAPNAWRATAPPLAWGANPTCALHTVCHPTQQWETKAPTSSSDRECTDHKFCTATEWESTAAGPHNDRVCKAHTTCTESLSGGRTFNYLGQWISTRAGTHHDRVCSPLSPCTATQWESTAANKFANRVCTEHTTCSSTEYETEMAENYKDRVCASHTICPADKWETKAAGTHHDRECQQLTQCTHYDADGKMISTKWETKAATLTSDRSCEEHTVCGHSIEWETKAAGTHHDRECTAHTECVTGEWQTKASGTHHDRECTAHTTCTSTEWETKAGSDFDDRECAKRGGWFERAEKSRAERVAKVAAYSATHLERSTKQAAKFKLQESIAQATVESAAKVVAEKQAKGKPYEGQQKVLFTSNAEEHVAKAIVKRQAKIMAQESWAKANAPTTAAPTAAAGRVAQCTSQVGARCDECAAGYYLVDNFCVQPVEVKVWCATGRIGHCGWTTAPTNCFLGEPDRIASCWTGGRVGYCHPGSDCGGAFTDSQVAEAIRFSKDPTHSIRIGSDCVMDTFVKTCSTDDCAIPAPIAPPIIGLNYTHVPPATLTKIASIQTGDHDLGYKQPDGSNVGSRMDWTQRCRAGAASSESTCPLPHTDATDHEGNKLSVKKRIFLIGQNGVMKNYQVSSVDYSKRGTYLIKFDATDPSGNHAEQVVFALVLDDTDAPTITQCRTGNVVVEATAQWDLCTSDTAVDGIDGDVSDTLTYTIQDLKTGLVMCRKAKGAIANGIFNTLSTGTFVVTVHAHDHAGMYGHLYSDNKVSVERTITVKDTTSPAVDIQGAMPAVSECTATYVDAGARCSDTLDDALSLTIPVAHTTDVNDLVPGDYAVAYDCRDSHNNAAKQLTRNVLVRDTTSPVVTFVGGATIEHHSASTSSLTDPGVRCDDTCDKRPGKLIKSEWFGPTFNDRVLGTYKRKYTCFDVSGNSASIIRDFVVVDTDAPIISILGADTLTLEANHISYADPGAVCNDYTHGALSPTMAGQGGNEVNMRVPGTYTIIWGCVDHSGNQAAKVSRTVIVRDTLCPTLTLLGLDLTHAEASQPYKDAGATAYDSLDGVITSSVTTDGDSVDVETTFIARRSCRQIKDDYPAAHTADYYITALAGAKFERISVWCDMAAVHAGSGKALGYTYFAVKDAAAAVVPYSSDQGECAKHGLKMASFATAAEKAATMAHFCPSATAPCNYSPPAGSKTNFYLCSTNDMTVEMPRGDHLPSHTIAHDKVSRAEKGRYVIDYHVKDKAGNAECAVLHRTVIVRDTLPPQIKLHYNAALIAFGAAATRRRLLA